MYTGTAWLDDYQEFSLWQTNYSYTARDDLVKVVDALGNTTLITYDGFGLKTGMKDPDMGVWTYGYNPAGNLITQTDAKGQTVWFGYDGLNRLTEKRQNGAGGPVLAQYGYDGTTDNMNGIGRRTSISNTHGQTRWAYDWRGRVAQEHITITGRAMAYDAGGQPYSLLGWNTVVVSATYNALGQPARTRFGNGLEARYWYFGLNTYPSWGNTAWGLLRRACVVTQTASGSCGDASPVPIFDLAYWYDLGGNIAYLDDVQNGGQRQYFAYDGLSRLVSAWTTAAGSGRYSETYVYNAIGNFVSKLALSEAEGVAELRYLPFGETRCLVRRRLCTLPRKGLCAFDQI